MLYRVRLSVLEPPGANPTATPTLPAGATVGARSDELVDVRATTTGTGRDGEVAWELLTPSGGIVEAGVGDEAWARRIASATKLRRISFTVSSTLPLAQVRALVDGAAPAVAVGGRTLVGTSVRQIEEPQSSGWGWFLGLLAFAGVTYAARSSGMLGSYGDDWTTGAHFPEFRTKAEAEAWARKRITDQPWKVFSEQKWGGARDRTIFKVYVQRGFIFRGGK